MSVYWWIATAPTLILAVTAGTTLVCAATLPERVEAARVARVGQVLAGMTVVAALAQPLLRSHALPVMVAILYPQVGPRWGLIVAGVACTAPAWKADRVRGGAAMVLMGVLMAAVAP